MLARLTRKDFLEALFGEYFRKREGFVMVRTIKRLDPRVSTRYFPNIEILAKEQYLEDQNVFFGVCPHETMKPDPGQIRYITSLWTGLDFSAEGHSGKNLYFAHKPNAAKAVRSFPLPPSVIVESGWGVHLYWLLKEMLPIEDVNRIENLLKKIGHYFLCRSPITIDAALRLPETFNCKLPGELSRCYVKYLNSDFRYTLEEFEKLNLGSELPRPKGGALLRPPTAAVVVDVAEELGGSDFEPEELSPFEGGELKAPKHGGRDSAPEPARMKPPARPPSHTEAAKRPGPRDVASRHPEPLSLPTQQTEEVEAEEVSDELADEIVEKLVARLSTEFADKLADEIVARLFKLLQGSGEGRK